MSSTMMRFPCTLAKEITQPATSVCEAYLFDFTFTISLNSQAACSSSCRNGDGLFTIATNKSARLFSQLFNDFLFSWQTEKINDQVTAAAPTAFATAAAPTAANGTTAAATAAAAVSAGTAASAADGADDDDGPAIA